MSSHAAEILKIIDSDILSFPGGMRQLHTPVMQEVVHKLINLMKGASPTFAYLEPQVLFMGSYFEGLKISAPDEYDLNILLKLPKNLSLDWEEVPEGFTRVQVRPLSVLGNLPEARAWADDSGYLQAARVRQWLQSVIQRALNTLPSDGSGYRLLGHRVARSACGPAFTLILSGGNITGVIEVDLVPTFAFPLEILAKHGNRNAQLRDICFEKNFFLAVPKGPRGCDPMLKEVCWNIDCQQQEVELILDKYNMKPTIRLMKKFREMQKINLSSYCIKTLFFWEVLRTDETFWKTRSLSYLLEYMLQKFLNCLQDEFLANFWFPTQNMLPKTPRGTLQSWKASIQEMLVSLNHNDSRLSRLLLNSQEREQLATVVRRSIVPGLSSLV